MGGNVGRRRDSTIPGPCFSRVGYAALRSVTGKCGRPTFFRRPLQSQCRAMSSRCQRRIVSGVTMVASCSSIFRPRILPLTASRRRWSSLSRIRFFPSFSRRTRFSVRRYSTTSCCRQLIQPARIRSRNRPGWDYAFMFLRMRGENPQRPGWPGRCRASRTWRRGGHGKSCRFNHLQSG
jgi:hypothetical protein